MVKQVVMVYYNGNRDAVEFHNPTAVKLIAVEAIPVLRITEVHNSPDTHSTTEHNIPLKSITGYTIFTVVEEEHGLKVPKSKEG